MGCDIHLYCEIKRDGKWRPITTQEAFENLPEPWMVLAYREDAEKARAGAKEVGHWKEPRFAIEAFDDAMHAWKFGEERDYERKKGKDGKYPWRKLLLIELDIDRNYDLFGMLADVRNGRGFAGCETGDGFEPIADPRGLPKDVSDPVKAESDRWDSDGHSHSWLTLAELQAYFATEKKTHRSGVVDLEEYKNFKKNGHPESWSGGVSGGQVQHVTIAEMDRIVAGKKKPEDGKNPYTRVRWEVNYSSSAGGFYSRMMPGLAKLGDSAEVRVVFWFDN